MPKIGCSESFQTILEGIDWTTLVEKDGKKVQNNQIWAFKIISTTLVGKDWIKCRTAKIGCAKSFQTTLVGRDGEMCRMA